jgi:CRP-like cAMP-binding protein
MDQKLSMLAAVPLLAGLDRKSLQAVGGLCDEVTLPEGKVIARQGSTGDAFYVVIEGTVRVERDGHHLSDLGAGDFFGELALLGKVPRTATVTCATPCRLLVLGHREFHALVDDHPSIQGAILQAVAQRLAAVQPDHTHC